MIEDQKARIIKLAHAREESKNSVFPENFLWFWSEYPKKKGKLDALKAWKQTADLRPDIEEVIAAINRQKETNQWVRGFIPHPATWLRAGSWWDEE